MAKSLPTTTTAIDFKPLNGNTSAKWSSRLKVKLNDKFVKAVLSTWTIIMTVRPIFFFKKKTSIESNHITNMMLGNIWGEIVLLLYLSLALRALI